MTRVGPQPAADDKALATAPQVGGQLVTDRPTFLTSGDKTQQGSMTLVNNYVVPPRLKVMQKSRREPLDTMFKTGDLVAMPMMQLVAGVDNEGNSAKPFLFVPIFFFPEFISTNPIELGNLPMIRDRSFDMKSDIAIRSRNKDTRQQPHPDNPRYFIKYSEVLNFIIVICEQDSPLYNVPINMSFARAEFKYGSNFASLLRMRNVDQCYGCVFQGAVGPRKNTKGDWKGVNVSNPSADGVSAFVQDRAQFDLYEGLYKQYAQSYSDKLLRPDIEEDLKDAGVPDAGELVNNTSY